MRKLAAAETERDKYRKRLGTVGASRAELYKALCSIAANTCCGPCQEAALVARAALDKAGGAA